MTVLLSLETRWNYPDVLDGPALEDPGEVPLAFGSKLVPFRILSSPIDRPRPNELSEQHQFIFQTWEGGLREERFSRSIDRYRVASHKPSFARVCSWTDADRHDARLPARWLED
jgi:hypothetical protein